MSDAKKYYCFCGSNCKYETMTKEQILAAIMQAAESGQIGDVDAGFITKVKENNAGGYVTFWVGTQAQFNALPSIDMNCMYIFSDDTSTADMEAAIIAAVKEAEAAHKEVNKMKAVDISNIVTLKPKLNGGAFTWLKVTRQKFVYDPNMGIVNFSFDVNIVNEGVSYELAAGNALTVTQTGGFTAIASCPNRFLDSRDWFMAHVAGDTYYMVAKEDLVPAYGKVMTFNGWYFCNGEG